MTCQSKYRDRKVADLVELVSIKNEEAARSEYESCFPGRIKIRNLAGAPGSLSGEAAPTHAANTKSSQRVRR